MIEVIDQYGERHRFDDNHCIHDADSATGMVQIGVSNDSGDYDVVATFFHPARIGEVSDDTCFTLREVPAGIARQIEELRAENEKLKADAKYGWQAQELILKNQALKTDLAKEREELACTIDILEQTRAELAAEREKVKALEATWIGYNKLQEQLAAAQATIAEMREAKPVAYVTPLLYGSQVTFYKPPKPDGFDEENDGKKWYCRPLIYAIDYQANQDALCEALARECERLAELGGEYHLRTFLHNEAAAHRARKEGK